MLINDYISGAAGRSLCSVSLFWWEGYSTNWYLTSVFDLAQVDCTAAGAFVVVRRERNGDCTPLMVGAAQNVSDELYGVHGDAVLRAIRAGATELHVHLVAEDLDARETAMRDIAAAWKMTPQHTLVYA